MTKSIFILFIPILWAVNMTAQDNMITLNYKASKNIDMEIMRCLYKQQLQEDSLDVYSIREHTMVLQIGNRITKYADYKALWADSIYKATGSKVMSRLEFQEHSNRILASTAGTTSLHIFKNYPKGKITSTDYIAFNSLIYEEDIIDPKWKLSVGTAVICGYKCKKATARFRGRNYTAWYAPDIPINNGPWKFQGLPGLILKVVDDRRQISFECIGIEKSKKGEPIYMSDRLYLKTTKQKANQTMKEFCSNPGAFILGTGLVSESSPKPVKNLPYNPIELSE